MISITPSAADRIRTILAEEKADALRIFVQGGGCSGFQYGFTLEHSAPVICTDDDQEISLVGLRVFIDVFSLQYMNNAVVDFQETIMGNRFVIDNPNVSATCGCGSSFTID